MAELRRSQLKDRNDIIAVSSLFTPFFVLRICSHRGELRVRLFRRVLWQFPPSMPRISFRALFRVRLRQRWNLRVLGTAHIGNGVAQAPNSIAAAGSTSVRIVSLLLVYLAKARFACLYGRRFLWQLGFGPRRTSFSTCRVHVSHRVQETSPKQGHAYAWFDQPPDDNIGHQEKHLGQRMAESGQWRMMQFSTQSSMKPSSASRRVLFALPVTQFILGHFSLLIGPRD